MHSQTMSLTEAAWLNCAAAQHHAAVPFIPCKARAAYPLFNYQNEQETPRAKILETLPCKSVYM